MYLPKLPIWLYVLVLIIEALIFIGYLVLVRRTKNEKCKHCGADNLIEATQCVNCGESMMLPRTDPRAMLGVIGALMGVAPFSLLIFSADQYPEPPVPELILTVIGVVLLFLGIAILAVMKNWRIKIKQRATVSRASFYGGYCAKCGTEILGGGEKCPKCGWKVNSNRPNWAIAAKNGKGGLPTVDLKVTCYKCKAKNAPMAIKCHNCHADLLAYKPVWLRVGYFVACVLFSLGTGWLAVRAFEDPNLLEGLDLIGFGAITLILITVVMPFYGLYLAFSGGKLPELLSERADRHLAENPWQALEDFGHALELAPVQEHAGIMGNRMKLYRTLGLEKNATREELAITYARERNPQGGMGLFIAGNIFGDSFSKGWLQSVSQQARKDREKMFVEGRAIVLGYCPACQEAVELTNEFKCPNAEKKGAPKHSGKPKILQYVIPADIEAGKIAVMRAVEAARKRSRARIVNIVLAIIAIMAICSLLNYLINL